MISFFSWTLETGFSRGSSLGYCSYGSIAEMLKNLVFSVKMVEYEVIGGEEFKNDFIKKNTFTFIAERQFLNNCFAI